MVFAKFVMTLRIGSEHIRACVIQPQWPPHFSRPRREVLQAASTSLGLSLIHGNMFGQQLLDAVQVLFGKIFSRSQDLAGSRQLEGGPMCPSDPKRKPVPELSPPIGFPKCCCEAPSLAKCNRDFPFSVRSSGKEPCTRPVGWGGAGAYGICKLLFTIKNAILYAILTIASWACNFSACRHLELDGSHQES